MMGADVHGEREDTRFPAQAGVRPGRLWTPSQGDRARPWYLLIVLASAVVLALAGAVQWQAPAGCPVASAVEARMHALLGRVPAEHELHAVGIVSGGPPWRLELETTIGGRQQRRSLQAEDCRALAEAAALILAVSVDPVGVGGGVGADERGAGEGGGAGAPAGEAGAGGSGGERDAGAGAGGSGGERDAGAGAGGLGSDEPSVGLVPGEATSLGASRALARASLRLRVGGGGETVAIPGGTGGVRLGLALEGARAFVQLDGSYWIDRFAVLRDEPTRSGARVGLGTVTVQGGVRLGGARVAVPLALGLEAGGLRTRAEGLARGRDVAVPWVAGVIGVGLEWSATRRLALWGAVEAVLPLVRPQVRVGRNGDDSTDAGGEDIVLHEPAVVGARALVGLSIKINGAS
jgi:hypothetical protein